MVERSSLLIQSASVEEFVYDINTCRQCYKLFFFIIEEEAK